MRGYTNKEWKREESKVVEEGVGVRVEYRNEGHIDSFDFGSLLWEVQEGTTYTHVYKVERRTLYQLGRGKDFRSGRSCRDLGETRLDEFSNKVGKRREERVVT